MNITQTNMTTQTYNGWANYETWNVALWIGNEEGLYHLAREAKDYHTFVDCLEACSFNDADTPDGVKWNDPAIDINELNEMLAEL
jgi:hypothetical protein